MAIISWATLVILAFIFIFVGLALVMFFTFFFNDGSGSSFGAVIFLLIALVIAVILPDYAASSVIPAALIALSFFIAFFGVVAHFLLPHVDNKDAIKAFRPLIIFTILSGLLMAAFSLAKVFVA